MITCLVLHHPTITALTKNMMVRILFQRHQYHVEVVEEHTLYVYVKSVDMLELWQVMIQFESAQIWALYGRHYNKKEALNRAKKQLEARLETRTNRFKP